MPLDLQGAHVHPLGDALGQHGDAIIMAGGAALDDRANDRIDGEVEVELVAAEFLGNHRERGARRLAHAEGERTGLAAHRDRDIPAAGGARVLHQRFDDGGADGAGGLEAEGRGVLGQRQVVIDSLGDGGHADPALHPLGDARGAEGRVITADTYEVADAEQRERADHAIEGGFVLGGIRARGAEDRAAAEVDAADVGDFQLHRMADVALGEPSIAVAQAEHAHPTVDRFDGGGGDHAIDAGRRSAADQDAERLL